MELSGKWERNEFIKLNEERGGAATTEWIDWMSGMSSSNEWWWVIASAMSSHSTHLICFLHCVSSIKEWKLKLMIHFGNETMELWSEEGEMNALI